MLAEQPPLRHAGCLTWLAISSGSSGSGNGTVSYSLAANTSPSSRSIALAVAGLHLTIGQAASSGIISIPCGAAIAFRELAFRAGSSSAESLRGSRRRPAEGITLCTWRADDSYNSSWMARVTGNTWTGWFFGGAITSVTPRVAGLGNRSEGRGNTTNVVWRTDNVHGGELERLAALDAGWGDSARRRRCRGRGPTLRSRQGAEWDSLVVATETDSVGAGMEKKVQRWGH